MNKLNTPFLLNVGFFLQESIGFSREFWFEYPIIHFQDDLDLRKIIGNIKISRSSEGLLSQGKFKANHFTTCSRCIEEFEQELSIDFAELFTFNKQNKVEPELIYPDNGEIDFGPLIREYFLLEMQISPVCRINCKGLCSICGEKIVGESCEHENEALDPRFSILKSLLEEE